MSLGRLLTSGRSLSGVQRKPFSPRKIKYISLPKFGAASNPFTESSAKAGATSGATKSGETKSDATKSGETALVIPLSPPEVEPAKPVESATAPTSPATARREGGIAVLLARCNPVTFLKRLMLKSRPAIPPFKKPAVQCELSLERVRVVRNDLRDAEEEPVVPVRSEDELRKLPPRQRVAGKADLVGQVMDRLTTRFFGND